MSANDYLNEDMSVSLEEVAKATVKVEEMFAETGTTNMEEENDYAEDDKINVDDVYIKKEPQEMSNCIYISEEYTVKQESLKTDDQGDHEIAIQETATCINTEKDETYDIFEYIDVKNEPCTSDLCSYCEECGTEYVSYCTKCPMLLHILHKSVSSAIEDGGKGTLPKNILEIRESLDHLGVFALKAIPKGVIFGPFYGLTSVKSTTGCTWKVKNGNPFCPENANSSNWMQYVVCSDNTAHKNVVPFQHDANLFFLSDREINEGEELLVYYNEERDDSKTDVETYYYPNIENQIGNVYACTFCCLGFRSKVHLTKHKTKCPHARNDAPSEEIIQCSFCEIYLDKKEYSEYHRNYCYEKYARKYIAPMKSNESARGRASGVLRTLERSKRNCNAKEKSDPEQGQKIRGDVESADRKPFECQTCKKRFAQRSTLTGHMRIHSGEKPFECEICKKCFRQKASLRRHRRTHSGTKPFECKTCKKCFTEQSHLGAHMRIHSGEKPFECKVCNKFFMWRESFRTHLRTHTGEKPFECKICKKCFAQKSHLISHISTHIGDRPFKCDVCGKSYPTRTQLRRHHRAHSGERPFECEICKKCFGARGELNRHLRSHSGQKPFQCKICKKCVSQKSDLAKHVRTHSGEKPFECEICKKCFGLRGDLNRHLRTHTGERPFECEICKKCYRRQSDLTQHVNTHSGEKPYGCKICKKSFGLRGSLKSHLRTHTEGKLFECETCEKSFSQKSGLSRHVRTHSGRGSFGCDVCKKSFGRRDTLRKHIRVHNGETVAVKEIMTKLLDN